MPTRFARSSSTFHEGLLAGLAQIDDYAPDTVYTMVREFRGVGQPSSWSQAGAGRDAGKEGGPVGRRVPVARPGPAPNLGAVRY